MNPARTLSIVIPAYNEEAAIGAIITRTLAARPALVAGGVVDDVEVIVVSDGSSDRTSAIAAGFAEIELISYTPNRGYGAAIKTGFARARGDLLGFLDADGTCDPAFFGDLCRRLADDGADIAIGARLGAGSAMPALRRFGNRVFAAVLNAWGGAGITDSASGMRVLRRAALARLYPLPDGMHFTPAMSSLAIFSPHLRIVEVPMPYRERTGASKLDPLRDGVRFLRVIADTAISYRPLRLLGAIGLAVLALGLAYGVYPIAYYATHRRLEEWMIYRLVAVVVALTAGTNLVAVGLLSQQALSLIHDHFTPPGPLRAWLTRMLLTRLPWWGAFLVLAGIGLNATSLWEYASRGTVTAHWIYVLTGGLLVTLGIELLCFGVLARALRLLAERRRWAAGGGGSP